VTRLILFDIDGTLVHTGGAGVKAFARAFATEFEIGDGTRHLKFAGRTDSGLVREMFQANGLPPTRENFRRFFDTYVFWLDHFLQSSVGGIFPGVREFLHEAAGLPARPAFGLLTGNIRLGAELKLRRFGLWDWFQTGGFGDDHEDRDQVAMVARHRACRMLNTDLRGDQIVVVGDTPLDIKCGRAIGARVIAVATGGVTNAELRAHQPDWLVENLGGLSASEVCSPVGGGSAG
jgi:phosphoglycolate phosphatase-like HAD superfamily hydrolase